MKKNSEKKPGVPSPEKRRPYQKPQLKVYGKVVEVTKGTKVTDGSDDTSISVSDRQLKEHFRPVQSQKVLHRLARLPIHSWNYRGEPRAARHIGPTAQDFAGLFKVGDDKKRIHMVDACGVAFAAIQALDRQVRRQDEEIRRLRRELKGRTAGKAPDGSRKS